VAASVVPAVAESVAPVLADPIAVDPEAVAAEDAEASRAADPQPSIVGAAIQTWLRYLVPLTLLSAVALSPLIAFALATRPPADLAAAKSVVSRGWTVLAFAWLGQLLLVGGASAMTTGRPPQLRAFAGGLLQLVRAVLPCLAAVAAIAIGSLALAVPGVILLVLLSLTAASRERGLSAPLLDSIATVRRQWLAVALTVAALFAIDAAIGVLAFQRFVPPLPKQPTPAQLAGIRDFARAIVITLVVVSPLPATVLATLHARRST